MALSHDDSHKYVSTDGVLKWLASFYYPQGPSLDPTNVTSQFSDRTALNVSNQTSILPNATVANEGALSYARVPNTSLVANYTPPAGVAVIPKRTLLEELQPKVCPIDAEDTSVSDNVNAIPFTFFSNNGTTQFLQDVMDMKAYIPSVYGANLTSVLNSTAIRKVLGPVGMQIAEEGGFSFLFNAGRTDFELRLQTSYNETKRVYDDILGFVQSLQQLEQDLKKIADNEDEKSYFGQLWAGTKAVGGAVGNELYNTAAGAAFAAYKQLEDLLGQKRKGITVEEYLFMSVQLINIVTALWEGMHIKDKICLGKPVKNRLLYVISDILTKNVFYVGYVAAGAATRGAVSCATDLSIRTVLPFAIGASSAVAASQSMGMFDRFGNVGLLVALAGGTLTYMYTPTLVTDVFSSAVDLAYDYTAPSASIDIHELFTQPQDATYIKSFKKMTDEASNLAGFSYLVSVGTSQVASFLTSNNVAFAYGKERLLGALTMITVGQKYGFYNSRISYAGALAFTKGSLLVAYASAVFFQKKEDVKNQAFAEVIQGVKRVIGGDILTAVKSSFLKQKAIFFDKSKQDISEIKAKARVEKGTDYVLLQDEDAKPFNVGMVMEVEVHNTVYVGLITGLTSEDNKTKVILKMKPFTVFRESGEVGRFAKRTLRQAISDLLKFMTEELEENNEDEEDGEELEEELEEEGEEGGTKKSLKPKEKVPIIVKIQSLVAQDRNAYPREYNQFLEETRADLSSTFSSLSPRKMAEGEVKAGDAEIYFDTLKTFLYDNEYEKAVAFFASLYPVYKDQNAVNTYASLLEYIQDAMADANMSKYPWDKLFVDARVLWFDMIIGERNDATKLMEHFLYDAVAKITLSVEQGNQYAQNLIESVADTVIGSVSLEDMVNAICISQAEDKPDSFVYAKAIHLVLRSASRRLLPETILSQISKYSLRNKDVGGTLRCLFYTVLDYLLGSKEKAMFFLGSVLAYNREALFEAIPHLHHQWEEVFPSQP